MKFLVLLCILATVSFVVMAVVDYLIGSRAEFLNAWSVIERLLGKDPSAGESSVYHKAGAAGEFAVVVFVNVLIGVLLASIIKLGFGWVSKP
jgi:hypothetical protein